MTSALPRRGYRPEIDGIRTIAVLVVVAFHAELHAMAGGFLGVDVFFVLSGFLITGLLVDGFESGRLRLRDFYSRRVRRLLPASLMVVVVTSGLWLLTATVIERTPIQGDATSAALSVSNWRFAVKATDYFAAQDAPSPFLHFWSLSAEEQFYLVWPAAIALAYLWSRRRGRDAARVVAVVAAVLTVASLVSLALTTRAGAASFAYFGTHNRAYQLLGGASLALWLRRTRRTHVLPSGWHVPAQVAAVACLAVFSTSLVSLGAGGRGLVTAVATLVLLAALEDGTRSPVHRWLASTPMVAIGKISYGVYLVHWPLLLLVRKFVSTDPWTGVALGVSGSIGLATISYFLLEQPIRTSDWLDRRGRAVLAGGVACSLAIGLVIAPQVLAVEARPRFVADVTPGPAPQTTVPSGSTSVVPDTSGTTTPPLPFELDVTTMPSLDDIQASETDGPQLPCPADPIPGVCRVVDGSRDRVILVVGDSHLKTFKYHFAEYAKRHDATMYLWYEPGCPWQQGVYVDGRWAAKCVPHQKELYETTLPMMRPDLVVVLNDAYDDPSYPRPLAVGPDLRVVDPGPTLTEAYAPSLKAIRTYADHVLIVRPWPSIAFNPRDCLAGASAVSDCAATAAELPSWPAALAAVDAIPGTGIIDLNPLICPRLPVCDAAVNGVVVRYDRDHVTYPYGQLIADPVGELIEAAGIWP